MMAKAQVESRELTGNPDLPKREAEARKRASERAGLEVLRDPDGRGQIRSYLAAPEFEEASRRSAQQFGFEAEVPAGFKSPFPDLGDLLNKCVKRQTRTDLRRRCWPFR